jgi:UDP-N-acetyl-D-mannosaminuronic acid dehydrogenase
MKPDFSTVSIIGLGYIGLPTAALVASKGISVIGIDNNPHVVSTINSGQVHIIEADLDGLVQKAVSTGHLRAYASPQPADVFVIAVPTPIRDDKSPDVSYVFDAARSIAPVLKRGDAIILESTCPIGTTEQISDLIGRLRPDLTVPTRAGETADIAVAYCPERVLPGRVLIELVSNDRCIGGITRRCARRVQRFYRTFVRGTCVTTTARTAELVKLSENSYRDVNIAFANELALICERFDINAWEVIELANRHPRVQILSPGPGVGGHCIAIDPWFVVHSAPDLARIIRTAREVNDSKVQYTVDRCVELIARHGNAYVACLGLAFKANIDDLRESPALEVATDLARRFGQRIKIVEPHIDALPRALAEAGAELIELDEALRSCGLLLLLVDHDDFKLVAESERNSAIVYDTRGIWRQSAENGRPPASAPTLVYSAG